MFKAWCFLYIKFDLHEQKSLFTLLNQVPLCHTHVSIVHELPELHTLSHRSITSWLTLFDSCTELHICLSSTGRFASYKWFKSWTFSHQIYLHFGSLGQHLLISDVKKSRKCPIWGQSDPLKKQTGQPWWSI